jgi:chromosomal replication initiation ATPase DnaA
MEVPESRVLAPEVERIKEVVCRRYGVGEEELLKSRRGKSNEPRNVAIYLTRQLRGEKLNEICREYGLKKHSSASSAAETVRGRMLKDRQFTKRVIELKRMLVKSQSET